MVYKFTIIYSPRNLLLKTTRIKEKNRPRTGQSGQLVGRGSPIKSIVFVSAIFWPARSGPVHFQ